MSCPSWGLIGFLFLHVFLFVQRSERASLMSRFCSLALAATMGILAGCGGDGLRRVPVEGKITAKGQPLGGALLQFIPLAGTKGEGGIGRSAPDGSFTLIGSREGARGLVPGEYKVRISHRVATDGTPLPEGARDADYPGAREYLPAAYVSLEKTPIKVKIPEAGGALSIDIPTSAFAAKKR
jgi:hypothetical protein